MVVPCSRDSVRRARVVRWSTVNRVTAPSVERTGGRGRSVGSSRTGALSNWEVQ